MFDHLMKQNHILIAGASGCGKSVLLNDLLIYLHGRIAAHYIYIDLKKVELIEWKRYRDCIQYADTIETAISALQKGVSVIENRLQQMQRQKVKMYRGAPVYIVIDELADLMTVNKKAVQPLIQRICQIGRAANVHLVACTQCPLTNVIPTPIKVNFDCIIGMRCRSKQDARNIGVPGLETLPRYGYCFLLCPDLLQPQLYKVPFWQLPPIPKY